MDTQEARLLMRDLASEGLTIVSSISPEGAIPFEHRRRLRELALEARSALPDAGYPGEVAWRALQRASMGAETSGEQTDVYFWPDVADELRGAVETLDSLVSPGFRRESDFHIVG